MTSTFERHESLECGPAAPKQYKTSAPKQDRIGAPKQNETGAPKQYKTGARRHEPQPTLCPGYQA